VKRFLMIVALACVLWSSALAGEVPTVGTPAPAPEGTTQTGSTVPGEIPSVGVAEQLSSDALSALLAALGFLTV
jgi:opacity protein-like surface antigen